MPQWRKLHTKATESLDINDMPDDFHRLLWVMLPLGLDREGRGLDNPAWIKAKIMPLRVDVSVEMIQAAMSWYANRGMVKRYVVDGRAYFFVPTFHVYQGGTMKEAVSSYPPPPNQVCGDSGVSPDLLQTNSEPSPDPLQTNSGTDSDSDSDSDVDAEETQTQTARARRAPALSSSSSKPTWTQVLARAGIVVSGTIESEKWADLAEEAGIERFTSAIEIAVEQGKRSLAYVRGVVRHSMAEQRMPGDGPPRASPTSGRGKVDPQLEILRQLAEEGGHG